MWVHVTITMRGGQQGPHRSCAVTGPQRLRSPPVPMPPFLGGALPLPPSIPCLENGVDVSQLRDLVHGGHPWKNAFQVLPETCVRCCGGCALEGSWYFDEVTAP